MSGPALRLAVSGAGRAFERLYQPALARVPGLTVVGVADPDGARAEMAPGAQGAPSLEALLAAVEADAVLVLSPPDAHVPDALTALARGLPVLAEKPVCRTAGEAGHLEAAGAEDLLTPAFTRRAWPAYRAIRQAGGPRLRAVVGIRTDPGDWDAVSGPPALADDLLPHAVDLARWLCQGEVEAAEASVAPQRVRLTLRMSGGQEVQCRVAQGPGYREVVRVDGKTVHVGPPIALQSLARRATRREGPAVEAVVETLRAWTARLTGGSPPPWLPSFGDAKAVAAVLEQAGAG